MKCGAENVGLRPIAKAKSGLPPGFLLEKDADGGLDLYMAIPVAKDRQEEKKVRYFLKGIFRSDAAHSEIESRAWELYMKRDTEHG